MNNVAGKNIMLYYHNPITNTDIPFACSTNCTFSVQVGQKEVTSQTSAWYKEFKNDIVYLDTDSIYFRYSSSLDLKKLKKI